MAVANEQLGLFDSLREDHLACVSQPPKFDKALSHRLGVLTGVSAGFDRGDELTDVPAVGAELPFEHIAKVSGGCISAYEKGYRASVVTSPT